MSLYVIQFELWIEITVDYHVLLDDKYGKINKNMLWFTIFNPVFCVNSFFFLFLENYGVRKLEGVFAVFIGTMGFSFAWMFFDTNPSEEELLMGTNSSNALA